MDGREDLLPITIWKKRILPCSPIFHPRHDPCLLLAIVLPALCFDRDGVTPMRKLMALALLPG